MIITNERILLMTQRGFFSRDVSEVPIINIQDVAFKISGIFSTILNWGNRRVIPEIGDEYLRTEYYNGDLGQGDITSPQWVDFKNLNNYPLEKNGVSVLSGNATFRQIENKVSYHSYVLDAKEIVILRENTFYYPEWKVFVDKKAVPFDINYKGSEGTLVFEAAKGVHLIEVIFTNTYIRTLFLKISILSWILVLCSPIILPWLKRRFK